ncbi:4-(cytidine 5'-diphospho)-2-C-methyl-D-erythritol kinase [Brevibacterium sp. 5221]|uniref:4-diphosphocytidyl-2-C-methyl-D-erythritol kinase n=1 Tax=Brevibacterium rongguiense TaxID=2695267 RepID=A0A6N9H505_9MICO|nr:4-(cytidine 5'-diphospho)-2-C-methyl-D-erythritol kinase [Brevibacterium rongguiense]MYM18694.1 4-(cytidine 5'-diphospho)-2-C-methyl-D-erythritol kinase [Brevibacterium rongguiense]
MTESNVEPLPLAPRTVRARAYGKLNLLLGVGEAMDDGYHSLVSVFQTVGAAEDVTLTQVPADDAEHISACTSVSVTGRFAPTAAEVDAGAAIPVPLDGANLAVRAVERLAQETGLWVPVEVAIDKSVPVAGGMGGGSADAAAALVAYAELIGADEPELLHRIAVELGADVPFLLRGGTALGTGRGDVLSPVMNSGRFHWVLATSTASLSTPLVYARLDEMRAAGQAGPGTLDPAPVLEAVASGDPERLARAVHNDLAPAALDLLPDIRGVIDTGLQAGALAALISGSGPTVGFLVADSTHALDLAVMLEASRYVRHVIRVTSPAAGAHVIEGGGAPAGA